MNIKIYCSRNIHKNFTQQCDKYYTRISNKITILKFTDLKNLDFENLQVSFSLDMYHTEVMITQFG